MTDLFEKKIDACAARRGFTDRKKREFKERARKALNRLVRDNGGVKTADMEDQAVALAEKAGRRESGRAHSNANKVEVLKADAAYMDSVRRLDALLGAVNENEGGYLTARAALTNGSSTQAQELFSGNYTDFIAKFLPNEFGFGGKLTNRDAQLQTIEAAMTGGDEEVANALRAMRAQMTEDANSAIGVPDFIEDVGGGNPLPNLARLLRREMIGESAEAWIEKVAPRVTNTRAELLFVWERAKRRIDDSIDDKSLDDIMGVYLSPKEPADYLSLAREYTGDEDLHSVLARDINITAKHNGIWQVWGTNPDRAVNELADALLRTQGEKNKLRSAFYNMKGDYDSKMEISSNKVGEFGRKSARLATSGARAYTSSRLAWTFLKQHIGVYARVLKTVSTGQGNLSGLVSTLDGIFRSSYLSRFAADPRLEDFAREFMLQDHHDNIRLYQSRRIIGEAAAGYYGDGAAEKAAEWAKRTAGKGTVGLTRFHPTQNRQRRGVVRADARGLTKLAHKYAGKSYAEFVKDTEGFGFHARALWQESRWGEEVWDALQKEIQRGTAFNDDGFLSPGRFQNRWLQLRFGMRANAKAAQFSGYVADSTEALLKGQANPGSWRRAGGDIVSALLRDMIATTGTAAEGVTKPLVYGGVYGIPTSLGFAATWSVAGVTGYWLYYQVKSYAQYGEPAEWVGRNPAEFARRAMDMEVLGAVGGFYQTRYDDEIIPVSPGIQPFIGLITELIDALDPTEETKTWEFVSAVLEGRRDDVREGVAEIVRQVGSFAGRDIVAATIDPRRKSVLER